MLVPLGTVPRITVAFDGKACIAAFHHQVDPVAGNLDLGADREPAAKQLQRDVDLEPAPVGLGLIPFEAP